MRYFRGIIGGFSVILLTACVTSHPGTRQAGMVRPAVDRLLNRGEIRAARVHLRDFGSNPGPVDRISTA